MSSASVCGWVGWVWQDGGQGKNARTARPLSSRGDPWSVPVSSPTGVAPPEALEVRGAGGARQLQTQGNTRQGMN